MVEAFLDCAVTPKHNIPWWPFLNQTFQIRWCYLQKSKASNLRQLFNFLTCQLEIFWSKYQFIWHPINTNVISLAHSESKEKKTEIFLRSGHQVIRAIILEYCICHVHTACMLITAISSLFLVQFGRSNLDRLYYHCIMFIPPRSNYFLNPSTPSINTIDIFDKS